MLLPAIVRERTWENKWPGWIQNKCGLTKKDKKIRFETMKATKEEILSRIKRSVNEIEPQSEIILFGSKARGDDRDDSDWDLLILIPSQVDLTVEQKFRHKLFELELEYGQAFSTFVYSRSDWDNKLRITPLYKNVEREGIRI